MIMVAFMANIHAQEIRRIGNTWNLPRKERTTDSILNITTNTVKKDTIVIQEIIKRTEVVHRTDEVMKRVESNPANFEDIFQLPMDQTPYRVVRVKPDYIYETEEEEVVDSVSFLPTPPVGGNYIWVPDSMESDVMKLLRGDAVSKNRNVRSEEEEVDKNEMVTFRGEVLPMVLKSRNLGRFDRGLFNYLFIPKGIWQIGLTASYGEFSTSDLEILDLVSDIDFNGKLWSVRPYFSYFLKSNLSLGLRLGYTSGVANVGSFNVDIDEDMSFNLHDIMYKSVSYSAAITFTQYLGIARKGRFGFFNEVELALAGGDSDFHRPYNGEMRRTHTDTFQASLNFSPGVCVYVMDQVSFNVSFGVFGLNLKNEKQKVNGEDLGERTTSGANFRFNIFNINFGIAVNI